MLPQTQFSILQTLRHLPTARFSDLMQPTGLTSDAFKFHIRRLKTLGYIQKNSMGTYQLTLKGKETANNFDHFRQTTLKQPKLSMLVTAERQRSGTTQYLFQQRKRHPYFGFWGFISGPIAWAQPIEQAAQQEFYKQTGLTATMIVQSFLRARDFTGGPKTLLEDKLFAVIKATNPTGVLTDSWQHGHNQWMTLKQCEATEKYFPLTGDTIRLMQSGLPYAAKDTVYDSDKY